MKMIAVIMASYVQMVISAFYSGLRGGQLFACALMRVLEGKGWLEKLPDWLVKKPFDPDTTYLDEIVGYPLAALGIYCQWQSGFSVIFPFNIVLLPLTIVEWILRWEVFTG